MTLVACDGGHGAPRHTSSQTDHSPAAATTVSLHAPADLPPDELARHERHMARAIELGRNSGAPFGCVIVDRTTDEVVCADANPGDGGPLAHGELLTMLNCDRLRTAAGGRDLILYTSAEPCPMCASAIAWAGIDTVVYATSVQTLSSLGIPQITIGMAEVAENAADHPLGRGRVIRGILEREADGVFDRWAREHGLVE